MDQKELDEKLRLHKLWLNSDHGGQKINLSNADLSDADLSDADLSDADLSYADGKASEKCSCRGCFLEQRLDRAREAIDKLFGPERKSSNLQEASDGAVDLLKETAAAINQTDIVSATINLGGCKAVLTETADEKIKIVRTDSARRAQEA